MGNGHGRLCGKTCVAVLAALGAMAAAAEVLIDFRGKAELMGVDPGGFAADSKVRQIEDVPEGVRVRVDVDRETAPSPWAVLSTYRFGAGDWAGKEFVLYCKEMPKGRIERNFSVNITDRDGEVFELRAKKQGIDGSGRHFQLFHVPEKKGSSWGGGDRKNGVLDAPLRLTSIVFYYDKVYGAGEATLMTIETHEDGTVRDTVSREPISTDTTYPGAAPFNGADRLVFAVEPAFSGTAEVELVSDPISSAWNGGTRTKFKGAGKDGRIVFDTKLPYAKRYEFLNLSYRPDGASPKGPFRIVKAAGEFSQSAAEAMRLDVDTGNFLHVTRDASERPSLVVRNPAVCDLDWKTEFVFSDMFGRSFAIPFSRKMAAGETVRIAVSWPLPAKGLWIVKAKVTAGDGSVAEKETRFAYIDRHEVTPFLEKPKFRIGIHYHGTHYLPDLVDPTLRALVMTGAKFMRTDYSFMFGSIARPDGTYVWDRPDMMMRKFRDAGLSTDIIVVGNAAPKWAVDPEAVAARAEARAKNAVLVTKPGVFRDFCEQFARRYNRSIDYYEVGNEWDMVYTKALTNEEALRMQREAYEGVHKGYPGGCVTPNGWASVTSAANLWGRATENMGIIEDFAAHPELYDAWMLHAHCASSMFYQRIRRCFLPLREQTGLKTRPWVCNETALSCGFGGEPAVGRAVWEKILYAWGWGASDYIWYNLRATGWVAGHEPGYGIITADFYPRSAYASMSALTTIFHGLDADGRIYSEGERHVFRFKGKAVNSDFSGLVLAAWDSATGAKPRKIRIRTDAKTAEKSDYMGNRTRLEIRNGVVTIEMSRDPSAYLLAGATTAEAVDEEEISDPKTVTIVIDTSDPDRAADFVLNNMDQVRDYYQALPQHVRRTWAGESDHSARLWLDRADDGGLRVRAKVLDDIRGPEDGLEVYLAPVGGKLTKHLLKPVSRTGSVDRYDSVIPFKAKVFDFTVHALEDDGDGGLDGYLQLTGDSEPPKRIELR